MMISVEYTSSFIIMQITQVPQSQWNILELTKYYLQVHIKNHKWMDLPIRLATKNKFNSSKRD